MNWKNILLRKENHIGFVTLNRPEAYNVLNGVLLSELKEAIEQIRKDPNVGVVVHRG